MSCSEARVTDPRFLSVSLQDLLPEPGLQSPQPRLAPSDLDPLPRVGAQHPRGPTCEARTFLCRPGPAYAMVDKAKPEHPHLGLWGSLL